jgi:hypothetical protein
MPMPSHSYKRPLGYYCGARSRHCQWKFSTQQLLADVNNGDHRPTSLRALVHGVHGNEYRWVADRGRSDGSDSGLDVTVPRHV